MGEEEGIAQQGARGIQELQVLALESPEAGMVSRARVRHQKEKKKRSQAARAGQGAWGRTRRVGGSLRVYLQSFPKSNGRHRTVLCREMT